MTTTGRWTVGAATITAVVESEIPGVPPEFFFPAATASAVAVHDWLVPDYADAAGAITLRVQALVVDIGDRTVLVDPCVGDGKTRMLPFWHEQQWGWLDRFTEAGFDPGSVDTVVHTHLHADHVGWDTRPVDGAWVPTFPDARHLYTQGEIDHWVAEEQRTAEDVWADSVQPIFDAGLADVVAVDADLGDGLRLSPTPGHTPGHTSLWIESEGAHAVVSGDLMHHPVQCAEPQWNEIGDVDGEVAEATRQAFLAEVADRDLLVIGTHFPTRPAGRVVTAGDAYRFLPRVSDGIRRVEDPEELVELYAPDRLVHPYGLADLEEPFWSTSTWYRRDDAVVAVLDLGGDPAVYAIAADDAKAAATLDLLADLAPDLPERFLITGPVGLVEPLTAGFAVDWVGPHVKMHLAEPARLLPPDPRVAWLERTEADEVIALRATDVDVSAFFVPELLDTGLYGGIREDGELVAIAGVHVLSERHGVAAIGNVFTHPDHRGRGLASALTSTIAGRLTTLVPTVGLNVGSANAAARTVYERLGFVTVLRYEEAELRRRPSPA